MDNFEILFFWKRLKAWPFLINKIKWSSWTWNTTKWVLRLTYTKKGTFKIKMFLLFLSEISNKFDVPLYFWEKTSYNRARNLKGVMNLWYWDVLGGVFIKRPLNCSVWTTVWLAVNDCNKCVKQGELYSMCHACYNIKVYVTLYRSWNAPVLSIKMEST